MSLAKDYIAVESIDQVRQVLHTTDRIDPHGGESKPALRAAANAAISLDLRGLAGILEYEPGEYTITARAGTRLAGVQAALAEHGQYLPFDPPLVAAGATLGGTVAAGLSGSGRYRYGGVRDFLIGIRFVDGQGRLVRGGGKVVKNAAGFDLPKLMVGSLGRLGVLVEVSFKVFPQPPCFASLHVRYPTLTEALAAMQQITAARLDLEALDMVVDPAPSPSYTLWIRLGGWEAVLPGRIAQLRQVLGAGEEVSGQAEAAIWATARELAWAPAEALLVKVATTAGQLPALDQQLAVSGAHRRYAVGGNLTWIAWPGTSAELHDLLTARQLPGLVIRGATSHPRLGLQPGAIFAQRIKQALDPANKFLPL